MTLLPVDTLLRAVPDHDDLVAFRYDFTLDGKALDDGTAAQTVTENDDGDLIIEGYAAVFEGMDRQGENFVEGAFQRGIKSFLDGQSAFCFHHKHDKVLGKVLDLREEEGKGLWMKARVDGAVKRHPELGVVYDQIKKGTINALSVGGFFKRAVVKGREMIADMDFTEISATPVPVHPGTNFAVVAGKALDAVQPTPDETDNVDGLDELLARLNSVEAAFAKVSEKALPDAHDPAAASAVSELLGHVQKARATATGTREYHDHKGVKSAANALETDLAKHEAALHKLAAKVGPLPPNYSY